MGPKITKSLNEHFFKKWSPEMSYLLGYVVADGCVTESRGRKKNPWSFNITSTDKHHLYRLRKTIKSNHKVGKKKGTNSSAFQLQIRNSIVCKDLILLGIKPRKTSRLNPIRVPKIYFPDFVRGFFDGDGTVYIYRVNNVLQIKAGFVSASQKFFRAFHQQLCEKLQIREKSIHKKIEKKSGRMIQYVAHFYIDDCKKLSDLMYGDNPTLFLPRKRRIFEKWESVKRRQFTKHNYPSKIGWYLNEKVATRH